MDTEQTEVEKSQVKKLLAENRLKIDDQVKIVNLSDVSKFKLLVHSQLFDAQDFEVKVRGDVVVLEGHSEEKELNGRTIVKQNLCYEHQLPKDVDPATVEAVCPVPGFLEIEAPRRLS